MAHNPQSPQGHDRQPDPAGSTQMFRAFVDEGAPRGGGPRTPQTRPGGSRVGVIVGVLVAVVVVAALAWLALA